MGYTANTIVDTLYKFKPDNWGDLAAQFPQLSNLVTSTQESVDRMNYFLGLNIADSPMNMIGSGFSNGDIMLVIGALMIPLLSGCNPVAEYEADASAQHGQRGERKHGKLLKDHEYSDAHYVHGILYLSSGRYGNLLDCRFCDPKHPAGNRK